MSVETLFSPVQLFGYLAFVLGVSSFLQKKDLPFKLLMMLQGASYVIHFILLGNATAAVSASMSAFRSGLSMYTKALWLAWVFMTVTLSLGIWLSQTWTDMLPILASCTSTYALFRLQGIALRCVVLCGSVLWLANNLISGSIGGVMLEITVISVNLFTIYRLVHDKRFALRLIGDASVPDAPDTPRSSRPQDK